MKILLPVVKSGFIAHSGYHTVKTVLLSRRLQYCSYLCYFVYAFPFTVSVRLKFGVLDRLGLGVWVKTSVVILRGGVFRA